MAQSFLFCPQHLYFDHYSQAADCSGVMNGTGQETTARLGHSQHLWATYPGYFLSSMWKLPPGDGALAQPQDCRAAGTWVMVCWTSWSNSARMGRRAWQPVRSFRCRRMLCLLVLVSDNSPGRDLLGWASQLAPSYTPPITTTGNWAMP